VIAGLFTQLLTKVMEKPFPDHFRQAFKGLRRDLVGTAILKNPTVQTKVPEALSFCRFHAALLAGFCKFFKAFDPVSAKVDFVGK